MKQSNLSTLLKAICKKYKVDVYSKYSDRTSKNPNSTKYRIKLVVGRIKSSIMEKSFISEIQTLSPHILEVSYSKERNVRRSSYGGIFSGYCIYTDIKPSEITNFTTCKVEELLTEQKKPTQKKVFNREDMIEFARQVADYDQHSQPHKTLEEHLEDFCK